MVTITNAQEIYAHDNGAINVFIECMSTTNANSANCVEQQLRILLKVMKHVRHHDIA